MMFAPVIAGGANSTLGAPAAGLSVNLAGSGGLVATGGLAGIGGGLAGSVTLVVVLDGLELGRYLVEAGIF